LGEHGGGEQTGNQDGEELAHGFFLQIDRLKKARRECQTLRKRGNSSAG
jgi:hypothetical protein